LFKLKNAYLFIFPGGENQRLTKYQLLQNPKMSQRELRPPEEADAGSGASENAELIVQNIPTFHLHKAQLFQKYHHQGR
jgi:hypothetical protein